jgi:hypothetical protein
MCSEWEGYENGWVGSIDQQHSGIIAMKTQIQLLGDLYHHIDATDTKNDEIKLTIQNGIWTLEYEKGIHARSDRGNLVARSVRTKNPQNPIRRDDTHNGNPGDPNHGHADISHPDDVDAMLSQLEHYI